MKAKGTFSGDVIKAVKRAAKKGAKQLLKKTRKVITLKHKGNKNPGGKSQNRVNVPKSISKKMRKQRGF